MSHPSFQPPVALKNGYSMTLYTALKLSREWHKFSADPEPIHHPHIFTGAGGVPIFGQVSIPENPKGTIVGTYGITGSLSDQWFLNILRRKAFAQGYAVVLFDWRAHGKTAELSPTLTSDGLYEGEDFVRIAAAAKTLGCPAPFWFTGYSLGGQLALWGVEAAQTLNVWGADLNLKSSELGGGAVVCPSVDSNRSLKYLMDNHLGRQLEQAITRQLKKLAWQIYSWHPDSIDRAALERVDSIWAFDHELVISRLNFASVEDYYDASSPLHRLPHLTKPTLILYAADDPMFDPSIVPDLQTISAENRAIDLRLTTYGGHVGYFSSQTCQQQFQDPDPWWAWNRVLEWIHQQSQVASSAPSVVEIQ
ncbi:MAG: alpha/beta fold hydrolase [Synechococcales cyanobacterium T60_A2020_003]|nr:alpha/beta fold hydrolase [Synechococcales cyanobacterium T60_A2020_003]